MTTVDIVVGGQFGSEAKGHVCEILANADPDGQTLNIRVGGPNAGHTVYDQHGNKFPFRHLPVASVLNSSNLYLGPGSEVDLTVLQSEINDVEAAGHSVDGRLYVSPQATILTDDHISQERQQDMRGRIGSTSKGIGAARTERLWRRAAIADAPRHRGTLRNMGAQVTDDVVSMSLRQGRDMLIEGTQGYGLGLHAGYYPFCTSTDCRNVDFYAQSGLPFGLRTRTWVVLRAFPIRVAGNSGPMHNELDWDTMAQLVPGLEPEITTVTLLVRRIGGWDHALAADALRANGYTPGYVHGTVIPVLSFADYVAPGIETAEDPVEAARAKQRLATWLATVEDELGADLGLPVSFGLVTTGPRSHLWMRDLATMGLGR